MLYLIVSVGIRRLPFTWTSSTRIVFGTCGVCGFILVSIRATNTSATIKHSCPILQFYYKGGFRLEGSALVGGNSGRTDPGPELLHAQRYANLFAIPIHGAIPELPAFQINLDFGQLLKIPLDEGFR